MNGTTILLALAVLMLTATGAIAWTALRRRGPRTTIGHRIRMRLASLRGDVAEPLRRTSQLDDESGWTPAHRLVLTPISLLGDRRVALGHPTDRKGAPDRSKTVYSDGATPIGILSGSTGSGKSSSILATAALMHGRDADGHLRDGGSPMLLAAPKTELIEIALQSRLAQGPVIVFDASNGEALPLEGADPHGRHIPDLRPYLGAWSPLSECATWEGALDTALAMCQGTMGSGGAGNGDFWEASAARLVAAALWVARMRGPGTSLADVHDLINAPQKQDDDADAPAVPALRALADEIDGYIEAFSDSDGEAAARMAADARLARRAIADLVDGAETTIGSVRNTAGTALSAALRTGVATMAWDDPRAIDIDRYLVNANGTIALVGSFSRMRTFRPITSAFLDAVRWRLETRAQANGGRLDRQVLVLIDELTTITSGGELFSEWCASARSQRVQILYATQDLAGIDHVVGEALRKRIVANTVTRLWLPGTADPDSLKLAEQLAGEHYTWSESHTEGASDSRSRGGGEVATGPGRTTGTNTSVTRTQTWRPIVPAGRLASMQPGEAIMLTPYARHQLVLQPWYTSDLLRSIAATGQPPVQAPAPATPTSQGGASPRPLQRRSLTQTRAGRMAPPSSATGNPPEAHVTGPGPQGPAADTWTAPDGPYTAVDPVDAWASPGASDFDGPDPDDFEGPDPADYEPPVSGFIT